MKASVFIILFCIGIYFLAKATLKPSLTETRINTGNLNCAPPNSADTNLIHNESHYIILDRTSVILKQNSKHERQH